MNNPNNGQNNKTLVFSLLNRLNANDPIQNDNPKSIHNGVSSFNNLLLLLLHPLLLNSLSSSLRPSLPPFPPLINPKNTTRQRYQSQ